MSNLNPGGLTRVLNYIKTWVTGLLNGKANSSHTHTKSQITDFPTIPSKTSQLTNNSGFITSNFSTTHTRGTAPENAVYKDFLDYRDSASNRICLLESMVSTDKSSMFGMYAYNTSIASGGNIGYLGIGSKADGTVLTHAPTPAASDSSAQIATTAWVNSKGYLTSHQSLSNYSTLANTIKSLSISGKTITYTKGDGSTGTLTTQDTNTTYSNFVKSGSGAKAGLVPAPSTTAGTTKYLREDGTWQVPPDHTYTVNNATLTIQKNGTTVKTFTANASSNVTCNITVPTKTSELTNNSGFLTSHQSLSSRVAIAGDTMTGTLTLKTENNVCLNLRPTNPDWHDTISVQTAGDEAVVFATKNSSTSWMFINGEDSVTNHDANRWQSLTPALQIKSNKVAIGKLIGDGANLTYPLEVNGTMSASSVVVTNNSSNGVVFGSYRVYVG